MEDETEDEVAVVGDEESDGDCDRKKSAVFLHLLSHPKCLQPYEDFGFSVLCRARYPSQLKVLEAVCIRLQKSDVCKQKKHIHVQLWQVKSDTCHRGQRHMCKWVPMM